MIKNVRWAYMEHWRVPSSRGPANQYASLAAFDAFVKQIAALGITGVELFDFNVPQLAAMHGSLERYLAFLHERGIEKVVGLFHAPRYLDAKVGAPHIAESHDRLFQRCLDVMRLAEPLGIETFVVMPAASYPYVAPVTDDKIAIMADFWNRVGEMTAGFGVKTCAHHEFWCGISRRHEIEKFYELADSRYVHLCIDTAQHVIAGSDPVEILEAYADRCVAVHLKDTHDVDLGNAYCTLPDAELMAASVKRWFWEMGTPEGLVDFETFVRKLAEVGYEGWLSLEHDKADIDGGSYTESTAVAMWYAKNVLEPVIAESAT